MNMCKYLFSYLGVMPEIFQLISYRSALFTMPGFHRPPRGSYEPPQLCFSLKFPPYRGNDSAWIEATSVFYLTLNRADPAFMAILPRDMDDDYARWIRTWAHGLCSSDGVIHWLERLADLCSFLQAEWAWFSSMGHSQESVFNAQSGPSSTLCLLHLVTANLNSNITVLLALKQLLDDSAVGLDESAVGYPLDGIIDRFHLYLTSAQAEIKRQKDVSLLNNHQGMLRKTMLMQYCLDETGVYVGPYAARRPSPRRRH
jgi:hypothetical protein